MNTCFYKGCSLTLHIYRCKESDEYIRRVRAFTSVQFSLRCPGRLIEMNENYSKDDLVHESLWSSAIVRVFSVLDSDGVIKAKFFRSLPGDSRMAYRFFRDHRSKHISSKVDPVEKIKAGIYLTDTCSDAREILGVGNLAMKENLFECPSFLKSLCAFLEVLKMELEKEIEEWGAQVLHVATKDDIDCLYKLPTMILEEDGDVHIG